MLNPIIVLYTYFPEKFALRILLLITLAALSSAILNVLLRKGKISRKTALLSLTLIVYLLLLFFYIVLGRRSQDYNKFSLQLIEPYQRLIQSGTSWDYKEVIVNIASFIPIGFLTGCIAKRKKVLKGTAVAFAFSLLCEILQFIMRNGYSEVKDVINNTFGAFLGALLCVIILSIIKKKGGKLSEQN